MGGGEADLHEMQTHLEQFAEALGMDGVPLGAGMGGVGAGVAWGGGRPGAAFGAGRCVL